jgi:hypothetical protein
MLTINNGSGFYKGAIIEYTLYNAAHSKFRTGRFTTFFDSVGFTSVPGVEDVYYFQGAGWDQPAGGGGFSFRWYTTGAGVLTFTISNTSGETAYFRADVKLIGFIRLIHQYEIKRKNSRTASFLRRTDG